jgi:hypothetical protein
MSCVTVARTERDNFLYATKTALEDCEPQATLGLQPQQTEKI